ncbi:Putative Methylenetetrahydrofolate dehydrogenase [Penicillium brasilianum]|uniref:Putative Methylenetetrahydrofolate dehydrogenase n=1 Tax=Penicillium brasilianum TaxID=104259 RepID=A0A0F7U3L2_PENBI|nr:Putative Methylenetetrahydrofolate dehydrogenase [Penicillium brasilianum]
MSATASSSPSSYKVMLSKHVANGLLQEVQKELKTLEKPPHLVGFLANNDPDALMYAQWTQKSYEEQGTCTLT